MAACLWCDNEFLGADVKIFRHVFLAALAMNALAVPVAIAQQACREGRTASGECIRPGLAADLRQRSLVYAQPKISQTALPIMPIWDYRYRYPNGLIPTPLKPAPKAGPWIP
jgi:hypothetical protein